MAEEKSDSENPGGSVRKYPPFPTTPEAEVAKDTTEVATYTINDQPPGHRVPNATLLVLSWGVFAIGLYFVYVCVMGTYNDDVPELRLAVTFVLALLTFPIGVFLRRSAYHGFRQAFIDLLSRGGVGGDSA